jgi:hypothetical protein
VGAAGAAGFAATAPARLLSTSRPRAERRSVQAAGRLASVISGGGLTGFGFFGGGGGGLNQLASSAPQPSPGGGSAWLTQPARPGGHSRRTWKWSSCPHQGRS